MSQQNKDTQYAIKSPKLFVFKWSTNYKDNISQINSKVQVLRNLQQQQTYYQTTSKGDNPTFVEKCGYLHDVSLHRARKYMAIYISLMFISGFLGAAGGTIAGIVNLISGLSMCGASALLTVIIILFRLGPLSETFSSIAVQASHLSYTINSSEIDEAKYDLLLIQYEMAIFSTDMLIDW